MSQRTVTASELAALAGRAVWVSRWFTVDQTRIDAFAATTGDHQFIHTDPHRAARETPFGGTVAHGFLTLSLLSPMSEDALPGLAGTRLAVNYGFDRVRFPAPVPAGSQLRGHFRIAACDLSRPGEVATRYEVTVEIHGTEKPALVADWLTRSWGEFGPDR